MAAPQTANEMGMSCLQPIKKIVLVLVLPSTVKASIDIKAKQAIALSLKVITATDQYVAIFP